MNLGSIPRLPGLNQHIGEVQSRFPDRIAALYISISKSFSNGSLRWSIVSSLASASTAKEIKQRKLLNPIDNSYL